MPIATPPPDFDPTIVPPSHSQPTEAETWETGVATDEPVQSAAQATDKQITDLVKLWPEDRSAGDSLLSSMRGDESGAP